MTWMTEECATAWTMNSILWLRNLNAKLMVHEVAHYLTSFLGDGVYKLHCNVMLCLKIFYCAYCMRYSQIKYTARFGLDLTYQTLDVLLLSLIRWCALRSALINLRLGCLLSAAHIPLKKSSELTWTWHWRNSLKGLFQPKVRCWFVILPKLQKI